MSAEAKYKPDYFFQKNELDNKRLNAIAINLREELNSSTNESERKKILEYLSMIEDTRQEKEKVLGVYAYQHSILEAKTKELGGDSEAVKVLRKNLDILGKGMHLDFDTGENF